MGLSKKRHQALGIKSPMRPVVVLPNVEVIAAFHAVIREEIHRIVNLITAKNAANSQNNRRIGRIAFKDQSLNLPQAKG
jgi:hypothetical protein